MKPTKFCLNTLLLVLSAIAAAKPPTYGIVGKLPIGGAGGWDYLTLDSASHRLYLSRGSHVMVVDVRLGKIVGDIPNTQGVHGIALAPNLGKGFVSNGRDNSVTVFDLPTLKETARVKVGRNPDAILFDTATNRVFAFNGGSADATVLDGKTNAILATIPLDGKPEFAQADGAGALFVNIEDKSEITQINTKNLKVVRSWPLAPGEEPSGLAFDVRSHHLFSTCGNNILAVSDVVAGKMIATAKIGNGPDAAVFDPNLHLAFSSNGSDGTLTVVQCGPGNVFTTIQELATQVSARTMTLDPATHRIYLLAAEFDAPAPGQRRGQMKPNSAFILVVGPQ